MTRFTLLASVATLAAAPAFADNHMSEDSANAEGDQTQQMAQDSGNQQSGQQGSADQMMGDNQYASGTMDSGQLEGLIRTSNIVGGDVYAVDQEDEWSEQEWNELEFVEATDDGWEDIGNITDVVLSPDGQQAGLIVSHGGFLDIGDDTVLLTMNDVKRIGSVDAVDGDYNYVVRMTEDQIEQMNEVEENWF